MTSPLITGAVVSEETAAPAAPPTRPFGVPHPTPPRRGRKRRGDGLTALAYLWPGLAGFVFFIVVPLIGSLVISLFEWPLFGAPTFIGLANYQKLFSDPTFYTVLINTIIFAFGVRYVYRLLRDGLSEPDAEAGRRPARTIAAALRREAAP